MQITLLSGAIAMNGAINNKKNSL